MLIDNYYLSSPDARSRNTNAQSFTISSMSTKSAPEQFAAKSTINRNQQGGQVGPGETAESLP